LDIGHWTLIGIWGLVIGIGMNRTVATIKPYTPQAVFILIAVIFGLASATLTPPLQAPDEPNHWMRCYQLSQGHCMSTNFGGEIPRSITQIIADFAPLQSHPKNKTSRQFILNEFHRPLIEHDCEFVPFPSTSLYSVVPYAPQASAMMAGRLAGLPAIALLYLGRFAAVFTFALLGWLAIGISPIIKWPMCLILTSPVSLFLAGSISADPITIGLSSLTVALVLRCIISIDRIHWRTTAALLAVMIGIALCKSAYAPLSLMLLAIDPRKWGTRSRGWTIALLIILASFAASAGWSMMTHPLNIHELGDDPAVQLRWIEHHPIAYTTNVCRSLASQTYPMLYSGIGILGWLDTPMPRGFFYLYLILLAGSIFLGDEKHPLHVQPRLIAAGVSLACITLITTAVYLVWDKIGQSPIIGLQGRYFLPIAPLLFLIFRRRGNFTPNPLVMAGIFSGTSLWFLFIIHHRYF
jgi:uncharacterized membrane protein